jgi:pimeloyl-ACP methyl ester carboxylesterase
VEDIAQLLGDGVHLVGFSYGGALALLAAVRRPEAVHSLAVIEPAAFGLARGNPDADWHMEQMGKVWASAPYVTPEEFDVAFDAAAGFVHEPSQLTPRQRKNVQAVMLRQPPWAADVSLDALAAAPFPKLVFSGGWGGPSNSAADRVGRACEAVCDVLVGQMGAERAVIRGAGHAVQHTGRPFNERLAAFLARAGGA